MAHLAASGGRWIRAKDLAEAADVPFHYLAKLLGQLVRAGLLDATRGKHGGYRLAKPAAEITLFQVVNTIEPISGPRQCLLWRRDCDGLEACAVHDHWAEVMKQVYEFLNGTSLDKISETEGLEILLPEALPG